MLDISGGYSERVAHVARKIGLLLKKNTDFIASVNINKYLNRIKLPIAPKHAHLVLVYHLT